MAGRDGLADVVQLQRHPILLAGNERRRLGVAVAVGEVQHAVADARGGAVRRDQRQARHEEGVRLVGRHDGLEDGRAQKLQPLRQAARSRRRPPARRRCAGRPAGRPAAHRDTRRRRPSPPSAARRSSPAPPRRLRRQACRPRSSASRASQYGAKAIPPRRPSARASPRNRRPAAPPPASRPGATAPA